jgi:hypothetical protein
MELPASAEKSVDWPTTGYKQMTTDHYNLLPHMTEAHVECSAFLQMLTSTNT